MPASRRKGFLVCLVAYLAAGIAALGAGWSARGFHPLMGVLIADVAATCVVFAFSLGTDNSSLYDPYWSAIPPCIVAFWMFRSEAAAADRVRQIVVGTLVLAWALRLTFNWARRWEGLHSEDWRYRDLRVQWGRGYWPGSLLGIHLAPTLIVYLACLPLVAALTGPGRPLGVLDAVATMLTAGAILIEAVADEQLRAFLVAPRQPGDLLDTGLWAWSRHPNYFGEVLFWWGVWLFGLAARPDTWWPLAGPVVMTALFVFVSVPMIDKHNIARHPDYAEYARWVPGLVPWFPRRTP